MASGGGMNHRTACRPARRRNAAPLAAGRSGPHQLTMAFGPDDLPTLRARVISYATGFVVGDRLDDVVLVVHELAANVVRHGGGYGNLQLRWDDGRMVCRISDSGPGLTLDAQRGPELPAPGMPGGRGLWIARRLADLWIDTGPSGTTVTATMS